VNAGNGIIQNLVAQLETIASMTPSVLNEKCGVDTRMSDDIGSDGAPSVVGAEEKGLDNALGKTMDEGKGEEGDGDPIESYSQVLNTCGTVLSAQEEHQFWWWDATHDRLDHEP
jgi:hypothetical protein